MPCTFHTRQVHSVQKVNMYAHRHTAVLTAISQDYLGQLVVLKTFQRKPFQTAQAAIQKLDAAKV